MTAAVTLREQLAARDYERGQSYPLQTLDDIFALYAWLPDDRGELFLEEIAVAIPFTAASLKLVAVVGQVAGVAPEPGPLTWVDDDKGEGAVKVSSETGEPVVAFQYQRQRNEP
jgi:hypothetical protein